MWKIPMQSLINQEEKSVSLIMKMYRNNEWDIYIRFVDFANSQSKWKLMSFAYTKTNSLARNLMQWEFHFLKNKQLMIHSNKIFLYTYNITKHESINLEMFIEKSFLNFDDCKIGKQMADNFFYISLMILLYTELLN